jgi:hypothetical protein
MKCLTKIPECEEYLYAGMPSLQRIELNNILDALSRLLNARSLQRQCKETAPAIGMTPRALYDRVRNYVETGDWMDLTDRAKCGREFYKEPGLVALPICTREFVKGIFERFQRNNGNGLKEIELILSSHLDSEGRHYEKIPGCDIWPVLDETPGWSRRNLQRFTPGNWDAKAARVGLFAASQFRPPVYRTRAEIAFCRRVEFDDHEWNLKLHWPGQVKSMRPRGFGAAEALTTRLKASFKPTFWDPELRKKQTLTKRDAMWFAISWLTDIGYRTDEDGTWFIMERGITSVDKDFPERVSRATDGHVKIFIGGLFDRPAHGGQMGGKGAGNFKDKPIIEGAWNLVDNYFSGLPGQVGLNRLTCPEELGKREQYFGQLLKAAATLPETQAAKLMLPFLTWQEFLSKAVDLIAAMSWDPNHDIEGWGECGFHTTEFRLPCGEGFTPWQPRAMLEAMPAEQQAAVMALVNTRDDFSRARNLSRHEAFFQELEKARAAGVMAKVTPWRFCELMGLENGHRVTVNEKHLFVIDHRDFGLKPIRYLAVVNNRHLASGESFLIFANPFSPAVALLTKEDGAAVGLVEQWETVGMGDLKAQKRMEGKQAHWEAEERHALEARHGVEAEEVAHMVAHNRAVIAEAKGVTPETQAQERRLNREAARQEKDFRELEEQRAEDGGQGSEGVTMEEMNKL